MAANAGRQLAARHGRGRKVRRLDGAVESGWPTLLDVFQQPRPKPFSLADDDGVEMFGGFLRAERRVKAAGHDDLASPAELRGDFVCPRRQRRHKRHADHVARGVKIQRLNVLVAQRHLMPLRRESGHRGQR